MKALARRGVLLFGFLIVPLVGLSQPSATLPGADDSPAVLGEDPGPPERLWTVRVGALATAADTQECVQRLRNLGYTSIVASGEGPVRSVWAGVFEYAVDAELCVDDLRRRAFRRVEIASIPATPGRNQAISRRLPVEAVFRLEAQHISETADPQFDPETDPVIQEGRAAEVLRSAEGDAALERLAEALPESDSRRAWIVLRLAHRAREEGQWDRALDLFQAVADGSMPVRRVDRINAMTRVGWILMYRTPDYRGAYRAYREIELSPAPRQSARTLWLSKPGSCLRFSATTASALGLRFAASARGPLRDSSPGVQQSGLSTGRFCASFTSRPSTSRAVMTTLCATPRPTLSSTGRTRRDGARSGWLALGWASPRCAWGNRTPRERLSAISPA